MTYHPLPMAMAAAVPLWIMQLEAMPEGQRQETIRRWSLDALDKLDKLGEAILFRTRPGESAEAFNATARGIAALAFCPGGVTIFGQTFVGRSESERPA